MADSISAMPKEIAQWLSEQTAVFGSIRFLTEFPPIPKATPLKNTIVSVGLESVKITDSFVENSNGELFQMLNRGVSLEHAYLALHMDDIVGNSMQAAMMRGQQKTLEAVRANGLRPAENGAGDARAGKGEIDLSKLTSKQMRDIEKRLMRGETITAASFRT